MKNKRYDVTPGIAERLRTEKKRHNQTNAFIAEYLGMEPQSVSRLFNGGSKLTESNLQLLSKLWKVRKKYLLYEDDYRTPGDIRKKEYRDYDYFHDISLSILGTFGYDFEAVQMLIVTLDDIDRMHKELLDIVTPHIIDVSKWTGLLKIAHLDPSIPEYLRPVPGYGRLTKHWLITDSELHKELNDDDNCWWLFDHIFQCVKITKNGELIGYIKDSNLYEITSILGRNTASLFDTMVNTVINENQDDIGHKFI